jgi:predicted transposase/invertase (TIGR01784 family)
MNHDAEETKRLFPLISEVGKFTPEEHAMTYKYLSQLPKPLFMTMIEDHAKAEGMEKGLEEGLEQGIRASKLEDARRMREHGIAWDVVTDITGLRPEDLDIPSA